MKFSLIGTSLVATLLLGPGLAFGGSAEYYHGFDDVAPTRTGSGLNLFFEDPAAAPSDVNSVNQRPVDIFWDQPLFVVGSPDELLLHGDEPVDRIEIGFGWSPDLGAAQSTDPMANVRSMAGSAPDRVGVRADLTAMLYDGSDPSQTTAWRVTGMLGSTSVSLAPNEPLMLDGDPDSGSGVLWDVGVGWSSGSVSLNADLMSAYSEADGFESEIAVLTFGAGYTILPGLSLFGEFNLVDESEEFSINELGTVVIIGTGVSF